MNKPTTQKPTEEQVQAALAWILPPEEWLELPLERRKAAIEHYEGHQMGAGSDMRAARILAAALEWERWERSEFEARIWQAIKDQCCSDPSTAKRVIMLSEEALRAAIDQARKET